MVIIGLHRSQVTGPHYIVSLSNRHCTRSTMRCAGLTMNSQHRALSLMTRTRWLSCFATPCGSDQRPSKVLPRNTHGASEIVGFSTAFVSVKCDYSYSLLLSIFEATPRLLAAVVCSLPWATTGGRECCLWGSESIGLAIREQRPDETCRFSSSRAKPSQADQAFRTFLATQAFEARGLGALDKRSRTKLRQLYFRWRLCSELPLPASKIHQDPTSTIEIQHVWLSKTSYFVTIIQLPYRALTSKHEQLACTHRQIEFLQPVCWGGSCSKIE